MLEATYLTAEGSGIIQWGAMLTLHLSLSLVCIIPTDIRLLVLFLDTPIICLSSLQIIHFE
jgi:hypothetical protein